MQQVTVPTCPPAGVAARVPRVLLVAASAAAEVAAAEARIVLAAASAAHFVTHVPATAAAAAAAVAVVLVAELAAEQTAAAALKRHHAAAAGAAVPDAPDVALAVAELLSAVSSGFLTCPPAQGIESRLLLNSCILPASNQRSCQCLAAAVVKQLPVGAKYPIGASALV
jgi:hypothetical protein